jgi:hypothetical protein
VPTRNLTSYYPHQNLALYNIQQRTESYWTNRYYTLLDRASHRFDDKYLQETILPRSVKLYAILNRDSVPGDSEKNEYWRRKKLAMATHVANGDLKGLEWCDQSDCDGMFPALMPKWTADVIAGFLGGIGNKLFVERDGTVLGYNSTVSRESL